MTVIVTFASALTAAMLFGYAAHRLKISPIVGYLVAGIAVGPFTPGHFADYDVAYQFAEMGVILLLFGLGLRFDIGELLGVWKLAVPGAVIQTILCTLGLSASLHLLGWSWTEGIVLGLAISVASTVVMSLVMSENHDLHTPSGHLAIGWTVVEDTLTVLYLLILPLVFVANVSDAGMGIGAAVLVASGKILALTAAVFVMGRWVIPWALDKIARTRSHELFTLSVLVLAMGIAIVSAKVFGVSLALGAFMAGLAVGRSEFAARAASDAVPMRDAFSVIFFVSVGMLFNPMSLVESPLPIAIVLFIVLIGKTLAAYLTLRVLGKPHKMGIRDGAAFAQVGEFSFILGAMARELDVISETGWNALVAASIISIALNPTFYRQARRFSSRMEAPVQPAEAPAVDPEYCVLVGFGPIGRIVHDILTRRGEKACVVDLNHETVRQLRGNGHMAVYGDVMRAGTLEEAGTARAATLVISSRVEDAAEVVRHARAINPAIRVLVRCEHLRDVPPIREAGADYVVSGEAEVGVSLARHIHEDRRRGGVEQAETWSEKTRRELYGE